jgi:hypothetical protein
MTLADTPSAALGEKIDTTVLPVDWLAISNDW